MVWGNRRDDEVNRCFARGCLGGNIKSIMQKGVPDWPRHSAALDMLWGSISDIYKRGNR